VNDKERREIAEQAYHIAYDLDLKYGCCPQCVLSAVQTVMGDEVTDVLIKASHGLSGGGALMGSGMCGALAGGILALGAWYGRDPEHFGSGPGLHNFNVGRKLVARFQAEFGGTSCEHLQHRFSGRTWNFWNASEYMMFAKLREDQCARVSGLVAKWVVEILLS
jgi:C_GCAxxG_C_C family probable redox protein